MIAVVKNSVSLVQLVGAIFTKEFSQLLHVYAKNYEGNGIRLIIRIVRYSLDGTLLAFFFQGASILTVCP